jgi:hypothetical protein
LQKLATTDQYEETNNKNEDFQEELLIKKDFHQEICRQCRLLWLMNKGDGADRTSQNKLAVLLHILRICMASKKAVLSHQPHIT